jgi:hypothetical protein
MSTAGLRGRLLGSLGRLGACGGGAGSPGPVWAALERLAYRVQLRLERSLPARFRAAVGWLSVWRPHLGSLCELRDSPLDPGAGFCLSARRAGPRSVDAASDDLVGDDRASGRRDRLAAAREVAAALPGPGIRPHDCYRFEYRSRRR